MSFALLWAGMEVSPVKNKRNNRLFLKVRRRHKHNEAYEKMKVDFGDLKLTVSNIDSAVQVYQDIFVNESHDINFITNEPLIYDLGANVGMVTLYYKQKYPGATIKAYEPNPAVFGCLEQNIRNNNACNVEVFNEAISDNDGFLDFYCDKGGQVSSFLKPGAFEAEKKRIASVKLKDLIDGESHRIDLIKMDIEGVEVDVLMHCGESLKKVDRLVIEYHSYKNTNQDLSKLFGVLEKNGFRYMIKPDSFADFDLSIRDYDRSHFDMIIHIEAIQKQLLN